MKLSRYNVYFRSSDGRPVIFNVASGAMSVLSDYVWGKIDWARSYSGIIAGLSPNLEERLIYGGFIVEDGEDELEALENRFNEARSSRSSLTLTICPTLACNLQCRYCFEAGTGHAMTPEVEEHIAALVEDRMKTGLKILAVTWYGGEPLLEKEVVLRLSRRLLDLATKYGATYHATVITNGTLLDPDTYSQLRELHVNRFQVTLDGLEPINDERRPMKGGAGSFSAICRNLSRIKETPSRIAIRVNTDRSNRAAVVELTEYFRNNGMKQYVGAVYAAPVMLWPQGRCMTYCQPCYTEAEFGHVLMKLDEKMQEQFGVTILHAPKPQFVSCASLNPTTLVIGPEGELYKCWNDVGMPEYQCGHIMYPATNAGILKRWSRWSPFKSEDCRECILLPLCGGGCPSKPMRGLETVKGHACLYYKAVFNDLLLRVERFLSTQGVEPIAC